MRLKEQTPCVFHAGSFCRAFASPLLLLLLVNTGYAQIFYDFVEDDSGLVLVTLELSQLPATASDVEGLVFTPLGQSIFGFDEEYSGVFDSSGTFVSDGENGLTGPGSSSTGMTDNNPPMSAIEFGAFFAIAASSFDDGLLLSDGSFSISRLGDWRLAAPEIPEPSVAFLVASACPFFLLISRKSP